MVSKDAELLERHASCVKNIELLVSTGVIPKDNGDEMLRKIEMILQPKDGLVAAVKSTAKVMGWVGDEIESRLQMVEVKYAEAMDLVWEISGGGARPSAPPMDQCLSPSPVRVEEPVEELREVLLREEGPSEVDMEVLESIPPPVTTNPEFHVVFQELDFHEGYFTSRPFSHSHFTKPKDPPSEKNKKAPKPTPPTEPTNVPPPDPLNPPSRELFTHCTTADSIRFKYSYTRGWGSTGKKTRRGGIVPRSVPRQTAFKRVLP
eukprot:TRINITY_DN14090_c0_g1_i1.p1 TRINITY_DN14090_c0_g1~~TRINITY_DN14090_c0_g1_i1.p1  ORF type:complete len:262 (+),score=40.86 TRINITY_DN14090_c0_g1_i1:107-892(+)